MSSLSHSRKGIAGARLLVLVAALVGSGATALLGLWQLDRARQKDAITASIEARAVMPPLRGLELEGPNQHHRRALVTGRWLPTSTVYLENRPMNGQAGFVVVTALELENGQAVMVQRGWQPRDLMDRTRVQAVPTPTDAPVRLHTRVAPPPSRLLDFEGGSQGTVRQNVDLKAYADEFGLRLLPMSLMQLEPALACASPEEAPAQAASTPHSAVSPVSAGGCPTVIEDGLRREWVVTGSSADKNRGYAVQWFSLSALIMGLTLWFQWLAPRRQRRQAPTEFSA